MIHTILNGMSTTLGALFAEAKTVFGGPERTSAGTEGTSAGTEMISAGTTGVFGGPEGTSVGTKVISVGTKGSFVRPKMCEAGKNGALLGGAIAAASRLFAARKLSWLASAFALLLMAPLAPATAQDLRWMRQTGSAELDVANGVAVDGAGNAYITGYTTGNLGGPNAGSSDIFLAKYDALGTLLWVRQTGSAGYDIANGVAVDGAGNAYITGYTRGNLGGPNAGGYDIFLAKYDASGTLLWMRQTGSVSYDYASGVAVDGAGNAYITGYTEGNLGGPNAGGFDILLAKYDASGTLLWMRQTGSSGNDYASSVAVDGAGNAYITGWTDGNLGGPNVGGYDIFLAKYDASGTLLWMRQTGSATVDYATGVAVDGAGNAYITGWTDGDLGGPNAGSVNIFLAKYDASGTLLWVRQTGTAGYDIATGVAVDGAGNAYITGHTDGNLGGPNAGPYDIFLAKYGPPCTSPVITTNPTNITVCRQFPASFTVAASGAGPLTYQWRKAGVPIDAAVNPSALTDTLILTNVQVIDGGSYNCIVTDTCTSSTSSPAILTTRYCVCVLADIAGGGANGNEGDGIIDGSDFIAFINSFAAGDVSTDPRADIAGGGLVGLDPDGIIDGTDFIIFINVFSAGC